MSATRISVLPKKSEMQKDSMLRNDTTVLRCNKTLICRKNYASIYTQRKKKTSLQSNYVSVVEEGRRLPICTEEGFSWTILDSSSIKNKRSHKQKNPLCNSQLPCLSSLFILRHFRRKAKGCCTVQTECEALWRWQGQGVHHTSNEVNGPTGAGQMNDTPIQMLPERL